MIAVTRIDDHTSIVTMMRDGQVTVMRVDDRVTTLRINPVAPVS